MGIIEYNALTRCCGESQIEWMWLYQTNEKSEYLIRYAGCAGRRCGRCTRQLFQPDVCKLNSEWRRVVGLVIRLKCRIHVQSLPSGVRRSCAYCPVVVVGNGGVERFRRDRSSALFVPINRDKMSKICPTTKN